MIWNAFFLAFSAIRRNLLRSLLTVLGIIIGVASVILLVTLGNGATKSVTAMIRNLGADNLMMMPSQDRGASGGARSESKLFNASDIEAVRSEISGITAVAPQANSDLRVVYGNANRSVSVYGVDNSYLTLNNWKLAAGRAFTDAELSSGAAVCILGETVKKQIFADQDPLGATLRLQTIPCQVIGLLQSKGFGGMGMDEDNSIMIPIRTLQRRITGDRKIGMVQIGYEDGADSSAIKQEVRKLMRQRRRLQAGQDDDFDLFDSAEILSTVTTVMNMMTALLSAIAAISLLVGGIGIMNIMLVSVTERTREIGVRLAIGAYESDVLTQFLVEAVVLSSFGGAIGILLGLLGAYVGCSILGVAFAVNLKISALAFLISSLVGMIFGFLPAHKAARLDPIEALRHE